MYKEWKQKSYRIFLKVPVKAGANCTNIVGHHCCTVCAYQQHVGDSKKCWPTMFDRFELVQKCWPTFEFIALEELL